MKYCIALVFVLLTWSAPAVEEDLTAQLVRQHQLNNSIKEKGIVAFLSRAVESGWSAPIIHSKWKVDRIPPNESVRRQLAVASRTFGHEVAIQLLTQAEFMLSNATSEQLLERSHILFQLADWLTKAEGYGNWFLADRCHDIASVGIAKATYDLTFPVRTIEPLFDRFTVEWRKGSYRSRVLNNEAGQSIFPNDGNGGLFEKWGTGQREFYAWRLRAENAAVAGGKRSEAEIETSLGSVPESISFFADSAPSMRKPPTLVHCWDLKWHEGIIIGGGEGLNVRLAKALLTFRKNVGDFPTEPKKKATGGEDPARAAFRQAWDQFRAPDNAPINSVYGGAFSAFKLLRDGRFEDRDTSASREELVNSGTVKP